MKEVLFLVVLVISTKYGFPKNLDEIGDTRTTDGFPSSTNPSTVVEKSIPSTSTKSTSIKSTLNSPLPEKASLPATSDFKEYSSTPDIVVKTTNVNASFVDNLSDKIRLVLKHFQDPDPIGIPGDAILPEPMVADNVTVVKYTNTIDFFDIEIWGLNNFSIDVVNTFLDKMEVFVTLKLRTVTALGNYKLTNLFVENNGPFNITFTNVTAAGTVGLLTTQDGKLKANKTVIDISYEDMEAELTNVSTLAVPFVRPVGSSVFEAEKPLILASLNERIALEINRRLEFFPKIPPLTKLSPVDLAILEARKFVRNRYEPFVLDKIFDFDNSFLTIHVGSVSINGVSRFARVGNITLAMVNQTVDVRIRIITQKLFGTCKWYYDIGKVGVTRNGHANFSVNHVQFEARILQNFDSRKSPKLEALEIETGPITVKMDGEGGFDYVVDMVPQLLPKMLRQMIIDIFEDTVKTKIQTDILDKINVEQVYEENLTGIKKYLSDKL